MKIKPISVLIPIIPVFFILPVNAQTIIRAGEVNGVWTKQSSPYLIKGDINIPAGNTLIIQPGVKVEFQGPYKINVQGSINAPGTIKDSIIFTVTDTTGFSKGNIQGWNGIRFDRRPVKWDTIRFRMSKNEEARKIIQQRIDKGNLDTTIKIRLIMLVDDLVNDTLVKDSVFYNKQGSQLNYCRFEYGTAISNKRPYIFGGAIYIYRYSNLVINNCSFKNNRAYAGGAIYCKEAAPLIINNNFKYCNAESSGGAMVFIHSGPMLYNNVFSDNLSGYNGGAILFYESNPYVLNNTIICNNAHNSGGGIYCEKKFRDYKTTKQYKPAVNLKFQRDTSVTKTSITNTILGNGSSPNGRFVNNVICANTAKSGGGISFFSTAPEFVNNTISDNQAEKKGGGMYCFHSAPFILNSIMFGNITKTGNEQIYLYGESSPSISYCDIETGISGIEKDTTCKASFEFVNNIDADPLFKNAAGFDYSLKDKSLCIDAGMPDISSLNLALIDLSGKTRITNRLIDIGALEYSNILKTKSTEDEEPAIDLLKDMVITLYPNPNYGKFTITVHNNTYNNIHVNVLNQKGQLIYLKEFYTDGWFEEQIDLNGVTSGIYIIMIHSDSVVLYQGEIVIE